MYKCHVNSGEIMKNMQRKSGRFNLTFTNTVAQANTKYIVPAGQSDREAGTFSTTCGCVSLPNLKWLKIRHISYFFVYLFV